MKKSLLLLTVVALAVAICLPAFAEDEGAAQAAQSQAADPAADAGQAADPMAGMSGPMGGMMGHPAITISPDGIYVIYGGMILRYNRDLKLLNQAELPMSEAMKSCPMMGRGRTRGGMGGGMVYDQGMMRGGSGRADAAPMQAPDQANPQWTARLTPAPGVNPEASGEARFWPSLDGRTVRYELDVKDLRDIQAAHIRLRTNNKAGASVAFLFRGPEKKGEFSGTLAEGTISAKDLFGPLEGKPLGQLIQAMAHNGAMVMVRTERYPEGALMGNIR